MGDLVDNKKVLTDFIQKQMAVLGPNIALDTARKVAGLKVAENGNVIEAEGDFLLILKSLGQEYSTLSEAVTKKSLDWLKAKYSL